MSEPKTLTLTLEEQAKLNQLVEREMDEAYYTGLYMKAKDARACLREFAVEVLEELGVRVAARDEAAELRAAVREYFVAWDDFEQREAAVPREERSRMNDRINAAWDELRRLAGGESEK